MNNQYRVQPGDMTMVCASSEPQSQTRPVGPPRTQSCLHPTSTSSAHRCQSLRRPHHRSFSILGSPFSSRTGSVAVSRSAFLPSTVEQSAHRHAPSTDRTVSPRRTPLLVLKSGRYGPNSFCVIATSSSLRAFFFVDCLEASQLSLVTRKRFLQTLVASLASALPTLIGATTSLHRWGHG